MDVFEAIKKRHSYRKEFRQAQVPRQDLRRIVEAGIAAPSGTNAQTTRFVIVDDEEKRAAVAQLLAMPAWTTAPAFVVCVTEHRDVYKGMAFEIEDCAAAVENMLLAVTALGYASVWIDGALRRERRAETIAELLGIPPELTVRVVLPIGIPIEHGRQKEKLPFEERAWFNNFGTSEDSRAVSDPSEIPTAERVIPS